MAVTVWRESKMRGKYPINTHTHTHTNKDRVCGREREIVKSAAANDSIDPPRYMFDLFYLWDPDTLVLELRMLGLRRKVVFTVF